VQPLNNCHNAVNGPPILDNDFIHGTGCHEAITAGQQQRRKYRLLAGSIDFLKGRHGAESRQATEV